MVDITRRRALPALIGLGLSANAPARDPAPGGAPLPARGLQDDVLILQQACEALHPGLLRYQTASQARSRFDALRQALSGPRSLAQAYLAFSQYAATVRCGHTYANFFNQSKAVSAALFDGLGCVPFQFRWLGHRMIVTRQLGTDTALAPGTEVTAIDGVACSEVLARLLTVARADGANDAKRRALLEVQGGQSIETFDVFLPLLFPSSGKTFALDFRPPRASPARRTVAAIGTAERRAARKDPGPKNGPLWALDRSDPRLALLRMPTWALYDSTWDWRASLQSIFEELSAAAVPALAIDLRDNEGGSDVGNVLLAHLAEQEIALNVYRRLVRYRQVPEALTPFLDTWDPSFKDWGDAAQPFDDRFLRLRRFDDAANGDRIGPRLPRYRGRVFVLIGATNSSATFQFAQQFKAARLGTLVGQTTGGNRRGINGGAFFFLRLPNSGIELDLPLIGQFPVTPQPDAGLEPDIAVAPSIEDLAAGRDAEMAAVHALLRSNRRRRA